MWNGFWFSNWTVGWETDFRDFGLARKRKVENNMSKKSEQSTNDVFARLRNQSAPGSTSNHAYPILSQPELNDELNARGFQKNDAGRKVGQTRA